MAQAWQQEPWEQLHRLLASRDAEQVAAFLESLPAQETAEGAVGLINGAALGILLGGVALLWKGNVFLGLVVGGALMLNTVVSVLIGGLVPLLLKGFRLDPAVASGPILTTVTDMCGFFLVLSLATSILPLLVG